MKTPSSSKLFESTSTGKSINDYYLLIKVTPGKRVLDFPSQYSPHGGKQLPMYGYLLKVGNIMKGRSGKEWYEIQMKTSGGLQRIVGYNTDKHKDASNFHNISEKISIDVKRSLADYSLCFGNWCLLCKASSSTIQYRHGPKIKSDPTNTF